MRTLKKYVYVICSFSFPMKMDMTSVRPPYNYEEVEQNGAYDNDHYSDMSTGMMRPLYGLFALPLFVVCTGILCAYVKHFLNERIHR